MKNWKHLQQVPVYISIIGVAALLSACGASSTSFGTNANAGSLNNNNSNGSGSGSSSGSTSGSSSGSTSGTSSLADALSFANIAVTGSGGTNPTYDTHTASGAYIQTDNELKVRVLVEPGTSLLSTGIPGAYSGFSANYNCVSYEVSIYDDSGTLIGSKETGMLQVPGTSPCIANQNNPSPPNYQDLDFSGSVTGPHGGISVQLQALSYDWYCKLWYNAYDMYGIYSQYYPFYQYWCPSKAVYHTHTVDASIQVQTNGTQLTLTN